MTSPTARPPEHADRPARVLIIEDHAVIRGVIRLACEDSTDLEVVADVADGESGLEACRSLRPDLLVLDLALPGDVQGLDIARQVRAESLPIRILVLTGRADDRVLFESIRVGVDGFLEKTAGVRDIADALQRIARGERVFTAEQERKAVAELGRFVRGTRRVSDRRSDLTARELEILEHLSTGLPVKQVATRLGLSPRTVETHIAKAYKKLGVANRVQAVSRAASLGLIDIRERPAGIRSGRLRDGR